MSALVALLGWVALTLFVGWRASAFLKDRP